MNLEKLPNNFKFDEALPTVDTRVATPKSKFSRFWAPLYVVGVFGCVFLLFHLYATTILHHAAMDRGLHELEEEVHAMVEMYRTQVNSTAGNTSLPVFNGGHGNHGPLDSGLPYKKRHRGARRSRRETSEVVPVKRGSGATLTWFHPGLGACGGHNGENDFIVAISHLIWDGGSHCGDTITISYRGQTVQATVVDECMGCDPNHIDLSPGLLHHIAGPGTDQVNDAAWSFGSAPAPEEKPKPKPTPTPTPPPPPPPPTTTSKARPTTSTSKTSLSTSSATSATKTSSVASTTSSSASASASQTPLYVDDGNVHNLVDLNVLLANIGGVAMSGVFATA